MRDLLIIGGSAAGTAAAIYAARRRLNFKILSEDWGGEVATSGEIGNWPGSIDTNGIELAEAFRKHVEHYEVELDLGVRVESLQRAEDATWRVIGRRNGVAFEEQAVTVIVATGVHPRHLDIPGEAEFSGKGLSYCTVCDAPLFKGKKVVTIGGGNSAMESVLMLADIAQHVTVVNINEAFSGETILLEKLQERTNVNVLFRAQTLRIEGEQFVQAIVYRDLDSSTEHRLPTQGVFVHIGVIPNSDLVPVEVTKNTFREIIVDERCATNLPGLFVAGDVTFVPYKQIAIAAGQGVTAALSAIEYINKWKPTKA